jgi:hypothetical protein
LRISVSHSDRGRFLERKDMPERGGAQQSVHQRQLGRARITENILDTLAFQDFKKDFGSTSCIGALREVTGLADIDAPFQPTSRPVVWEVSIPGVSNSSFHSAISLPKVRAF